MGVKICRIVFKERGYYNKKEMPKLLRQPPLKGETGGEVYL
jgi:hypothetical protein